MTEVHKCFRPAQTYKEKQQKAATERMKCIVIWSPEATSDGRKEGISPLKQWKHTLDFKTEPLPSATRHVLVINTSKNVSSAPRIQGLFKKQD